MEKVGKFVYIEIDGKRGTLAYWAKQSGVLPTTIKRRYENGIRGRDLLVMTNRVPKSISNPY